MKTTKLYIILSHFNVYELNKFKKFINSPYYNVNDSLTKLFAALEPFLKGKTTESSLTKEVVFNYAFPKSKFNDTSFRKLISDLLKLVETFLALQIYESNPLHKADYLLQAVSKKRMTKLYNTAINTARRLSEQQLDKPASYYYYQYQFEKNLFNLTTEFEKKTKAKQGLTDFNIVDIANNLDIFYLAEKIKYYCSLLSWKSIVKHDMQFMFIDEVIDHIKNMDISNIPPLAVYYQIYLTITEPENVQHFYRLKELIERYIDVFPDDEAKDIYDSAQNYCIKRGNKGDGRFMEDSLNIYKQMLENGKIFVEGELTPTSFRNICFTSFRLRKFDWAEKFINDYSKFLKPRHRENAIVFNLARLNFYKKDYEKVISLLQNVEYEDVIYNLNSKTILLAVYYELEEIEALDSLIDSFKVFVSRKKAVPIERREHYLKLLKYTKKLSRLHPKNKKAIESIRKEIQETSGIVNKQWLLTKSNELLGNYQPTG